MDLQHARGTRRTAGRIGRHVAWVRADGLGRMIEEDQLNPVPRVALALRKKQWVRRHGLTPGLARPVFLVGLQRSGTNMVVRGFERSPAFEVHNENDRKAFDRFLLRPDAQIRALVEQSPHSHVLFKPLCDSHRVAELLDGLGTATPGRAIWAYRGMAGRVRSAVAKFGDGNRRVLTEIASGGGGDRWQAQCISPETRALLEAVDWSSASAETGAAAFWYVRNVLYFELGLGDRQDLTLASYEALAADPERHMRSLCAFLDVPFSADLIRHIDRRATAPRPIADLDPAVAASCAALEARLAAAVDAHE